MPYMTALKPALIRFGLGPYLEEVPDWETRGSSSFAPACTIGHHTAGPLSGDRPSLNICVNGRSDLPGPLCNDFLSRSKVILVAGGRANHAGTGGFRGLVGNSAAFGNEAESNGVGRKDGTPDWSEFQRWAFPRVHAAHLSVLKRDASWYAGHRDWTTRKIDPTAIETAALRREIADLLANPTITTAPEDFMTALSDTEQRALYDWVKGTATAVDWWLVAEPGPNSKGETSRRMRDVHGAMVGQSAALTALSKLVAEQNGLTLEDVRRAVAEEVAKGVDVDVTVQPGS